MEWRLVARMFFTALQVMRNIRCVVLTPGAIMHIVLSTNLGVMDRSLYYVSWLNNIAINM